MAKRTSTSKQKRTAGALDVEVVSSRLVYKGPVFSVYSDRVREGRHTGQRDVIRHSGSVVILPVDSGLRPTAQPRVLLIRQYRYAAGMLMWELPAGRIDEGENKLAAAKRELMEETGITAKSWKRIFRFYASPGFLDETMDIYLATNLTHGIAQPEEDEQIKVRFFPLDQALRMVSSGAICDAKTMSALLWFSATRSTGRRRR